MKNIRLIILVTLLTLLAAGQGAHAQSTFSISDPTYDSSTHKTTFTITRSGNSLPEQTINYRTVNLSAFAGQHYTAVSDSYTFPANETTKTVEVTESTPSTDAYKYQTGTERTYRLEVLDKDGYILATKDRSITTGTSVPSSGAFNIKDVTIQSDAYWASDQGYGNNGYKSVESSSYFNNAAPKNYFQCIGAELRMTLSMQAKEEIDGYEYLQLLFGETTNCDDRSGKNNGDPGTPNYSRYMAGFEILKGSKDDTYRNYTFPILNVEDGGSAENPWGYNYDNKVWRLSKQMFKSGYRADDGRIKVPTGFSSIVLRLNASGDGDDKWWAQNVKAHIQAVDGTAPTVLDNYKVSSGRHQKGNTFYVSVPFSEILVVTGTPKLNSTWGEISYYQGSGSNVLTFIGTIKSDATQPLNVTGYTLNGGTIKDLAGNSLSSTSSTISHNFGTALDADYAWTTADFHQLAANTYEIASKIDLRHLALLVNVAKNPCSGLTFRQTQDITCDNTYIPIGIENYYFEGTYDGQGYTVSNITVTRTGNTNADQRLGLFGKIWKPGTVQNVVLANSTFTGFDMIGGIVGYNYGTVRNCRVESSVIIKAGYNSAAYHGGIVGFNNAGTIIGCISAASIQNNGKSNHIHCGGIAGYTYGGTIKDCLYTGSTVEATDKKGAIVGYNQGTPTFTNNYYTAISLGGVGAEGSSSDQDGVRRARTVTLGTNVTLSGAQTAYSASGLTAIGTTALQSGTTIYSGEGQTLTLTHADREGYNFDSYTATAGTVEGSTLTMPASDVAVSANYAAFPWSGSGTALDPWLIQYPSQLDLLATNVNAGNNYRGMYFRQVANLVYDGTENNYTPIGYYVSNSDNALFKGTYDGQGFTISGINVTRTGNTIADDYVGLFGYVGYYTALDYGTVRNVVLANSTFTGHDCVGGIVGYNWGGTVENCRVESTVTINTGSNSAHYHGGIAGQNFSTYAKVIGCISAAVISKNDKTDCYKYGGIVGYNNNGTIRDCIALGANVTAYEYKGAIAGHNNGKLARNYYYNFTVGTATTNIGTGNSAVTTDVTEGDGAVRAVASTGKPAEIGAQTTTYSIGLTAYEHGISYGGKYYLRYDLEGTAVVLTLVQGTKDGVTAWWGTFYDSAAGYTLSEGAAAYTMDADYQLYRLGTDGRTIPAGTAVVILSTTSEATLIPAGSATATDNAPGGNILIGVDADTVFPSVYVLSVNNGEVGLRLLSSGTLPAHKAGYTTKGTGIQNYDKQGKQDW